MKGMGPLELLFPDNEVPVLPLQESLANPHGQEILKY